MRTFVFHTFDKDIEIDAKNLSSALKKLDPSILIVSWDEKPKGLTTRQWRLKDYLEFHRGEGYITIEQVCRDLSQLYELNTDPRNHDKCIALSNDVRAINWNNVDGYQIIIKDSRGAIKYAETLEEFESWRQKELDKLTPKYQYLNNLKFKAKQDGSMPLYNKALNPVGEELKEVKVFKGGE